MSSDYDWRWFELFTFSILGAFGGLLGALYMHLNVFYRKFANKQSWLKSHHVSEVAIVATITALVNYHSVYLM
jgi:chloride channel 3/4/5